MTKKKIGVGMSGGVDSTTTAYLLIQEGHEVFGATMYLFDLPDETGTMRAPAFIEEARQACNALGIAHHVIDLREAFHALVIRPFTEGFLNGATPNPCTICNRHIKYGLFMDAVLALGADAMATGHYVRIVHNAENGSWHLHKGMTDRKDQSYYLHGLSEKKLSQLMLPLGSYDNKAQIRQIASGFNPGVSQKKDSLGICFTQGQSPYAYLKNKLAEGYGAGDFVSAEGQVLGRHEGYFQFTIGQKKGLPKTAGKSLSVLNIDPSSAQVLLGDESALYQTSLMLTELNWIHSPKTFPWAGTFRICTWGYDLRGQIMPSETPDIWEVIFDEPVRAIAKGQACVVYDGDEILGGGTIL